MLAQLTDASHNTLDSVRSEINELLDRMMVPAMSLSTGLLDNIGLGHHPAINIIEHDDHLVVESELPGLRASDLDVAVTDDRLTIAGERHDEQLDHDGEVSDIRRERRSLQFSRTIKLPTKVEHEHIEAELKDGVLTITLAKVRPARTHRIAVRS